MTKLQMRALALEPLTAEFMEQTYEREGPVLWRVMKQIIESHERLRMELEGSAVLHDDSAKALRQAADDAQRMRDGLLRVFARCEIWSAEDIRANVADLLDMTVKAVQADIDQTGGK